MFEQDHSESPAALEASSEQAPSASGASGERKVSSMVLLAAGGVLVATICATFASMLANGSSKPEAGPPKAESEVESDQPSVTSTSMSIAPDGSTATVVVTVPGKARGEDGAQKVVAPATTSAPEVVVTQTEDSVAETTVRRPSAPPSSSAVSSAPVESSSVVPSVSVEPSS